jgi:hypothetical protein
MKIIIDHAFGNQEDYDLQLVKLKLIDVTDDKEPLENGWLFSDGQWYATRSTRLKISNYVKQPKPIKGYRFEYRDQFEVTEEVLRVYNQFVFIKNFQQRYDLNNVIERSSGLFVYRGDELVAFTKFVKYDCALESQFTAWDYSDPRASIGRRIIDFEVDICRKMGYDYLYIGQAYGIGCSYKTRLDGFEWWTGAEWSTDMEALNNLLERDSSITNFRELTDAFVQGP